LQVLKTLWNKVTSGTERSARIRGDADARDDPKKTTPVVHVSSEAIAKFSEKEAGVSNPISDI